MQISQKYILWDFDGVIIDSNLIRTNGFKYIFREFKSHQINQIIDYHLENGGLSRYNKINYFFKSILNSEIDEFSFKNYLNEFSEYVINEILNNNVLIMDTIDYVRNNSKKNIIISASDQDELRYLCNKLNINSLFEGIYGSPTKKEDNIMKVIKDFEMPNGDIIYIGDSINDYNASVKNKIPFLGFNNNSFEKMDINVINKFVI